MSDTATPPPDKYDEAVYRLQEIAATCGEAAFREAIDAAWGYPKDLDNGCLFDYCCRGTSSLDEHGNRLCGCLTQVRNGHFPAATPTLTYEIRDDERIPNDPSLITPDDLPVFAEWQRRLDQVLAEVK